MQMQKTYIKRGTKKYNCEHIYLIEQENEDEIDSSSSEGSDDFCIVFDNLIGYSTEQPHCDDLVDQHTNDGGYHQA